MPLILEMTTIYLILGINDQGFPDIKETLGYMPSAETVDFYRRICLE